MSETGIGAQYAKAERPWHRRRRKVRAAIRHVMWLIQLFVYYRYLYRAHMRFLHRRGKHWFTRMHMEDGRQQDWCQWCGERRFYDQKGDPA